MEGDPQQPHVRPPAPGVYLQRAINEGIAVITASGKTSRISYVAAQHSERFSDPEEWVRAEYWAELIYRYGYEPSRIGVEVIVPDRKPHDTADLVVFEDLSRKRPYAVIECKREGISDAEFGQAIEQAVGNGMWVKLQAQYVGVVAGGTRRFFEFGGKYPVLEREANIVADLPARYGKPQDFKYRKGGTLDIRPVHKEELIAAIKKCHQTLWGGGRLSPPAAFGELCKVIFVKISDETAPRRKNEPYQFQIKTHESSRALAERIRELYEKQKARDPDVFTETLRINDQTLRTIVSHLESINLSKTDLDVKGMAFEQFMDGFFKGDFGQYFTPREIIDFAVGMVRPAQNEKVLDPACGSGGFLLHALDYVRAAADEFFEPETPEHFRYWHDFAQHQLYGIEINDEIARVAKMNMILHDDGHTNVVGGDALDSPSRLSQLHPRLKLNAFDVVLTNPPFGAQVSREEHPYLTEYALACSPAGVPKKSQKTEVLFLERVARFLKPGGRAAIVVPDGILTNSSLQQVRDFLIDNYRLRAVVSLPGTAFSHYGANVKASVIIVTKRPEGEAPDGAEQVFMAVAEHIGYDATGRRIDKNDLPAIAGEFREFEQEFAQGAIS